MNTEWFPTLFAKLSQDILNHEIPPLFLESVQDHYSQLKKVYGTKSGPVRLIRQRLEGRPAIIRADLREKLDLGKPLFVSVTGPADVRLRVDSYAYTSGYSGWHFPDWPVVVEVPERELPGFSHWIVNEQRHEGARLELHPEKATQVEAIYEQ
jgi:hypothetical protein